MDSATTPLLQVHSLKLGERARLSTILTSMVTDGYNVQRQFDVGQIMAADAMCFVFSNGVVVNWGSEQILQRLLQSKATYIVDPIDPVIEDHLEYKLGDEFTIEHDVIILPTTDPTIMLSISYALVKELQLSHNEQVVDAVVKQAEPLAHSLAHDGKIHLGKAKIKKLIGQILEIQFNLSSAAVIQDKPDLFWDKPEFEQYYIKVAGHLDISDRALVVQKKIEALHETAEILRDEANTHYAHILEWVVILLISWEILFSAWEHVIELL